MSLERQMAAVKEVYGDNIPQLDKIYYGSVAKKYGALSSNDYITPYFLHEIFTVEEMEYIDLLPASAEKLAEKTGKDVETVRAHMERLLSLGYVLDNFRTPRVYCLPNNCVNYRDNIQFRFFMGDRSNWNEFKNLANIVEKWCDMDPDDGFPANKVLNMRCIPKWGSIKDLPGVMFCENMKEIIQYYAPKKKMVTAQCLCRFMRSYREHDEFVPGNCKVFPNEIDGQHGHCMNFGDDMVVTVPESMQDIMTTPNLEMAMRLFEESEASNCVYEGANARLLRNVCNCCYDCCPVIGFVNNGVDCIKPSRFRPYLKHGDLCVGCGTCASICPFHAIYMDNGQPSILADKCKGCGNCVMRCPTKALKMQTVHPPEWVPDCDFPLDTVGDDGAGSKTVK